jgi:ribulose-5-phosphate 4-epimerase/fuculose-1-phosphate aldolase
MPTPSSTTTAPAPTTTATGARPWAAAAPTRDEVRTALVVALRALAEHEFGFNGHVTARDVDPGTYWANPFGVPLALVEPDDLVRLDDDGSDVENPRGHRVNGFAGNLAIHRARPDAAAVVHLHTRHGFVWSSLDRPLEPVTTDAALVTGLQALHPRFGEPAAPADALGADAKVLLQRTHGFITLGRSVDEAAFYLVAAERAAHANLLLRDEPGRTVIAPETAARWTLTPELAEQHFAPYRARALAALGGAR